MTSFRADRLEKLFFKFCFQVKKGSHQKERIQNCIGETFLLDLLLVTTVYKVTKLSSLDVTFFPLNHPHVHHHPYESSYTVQKRRSDTPIYYLHSCAPPSCHCPLSVTCQVLPNQLLLLPHVCDPKIFSGSNWSTPHICNVDKHKNLKNINMYLGGRVNRCSSLQQFLH